MVLSFFAFAVAACGDEKRTPLGRDRNELSAGKQTFDLVAVEPKDHPGGLKHLPRIEVTVPDGWFNFDGWAIHKGRAVETTPVFLTFWDVDQVYPTPCKWENKPMVDPGRGVSRLASALARQPLRNATAPREVVLERFRGKYLQWSVPNDIAFDQAHPGKALFPDCDDRTFQSWTSRGWNSDRYQQAPGQVDRIWILDVNGERLVIDASYMPDASVGDRAELDEIIHSIRFL